MNENETQAQDETAAPAAEAQATGGETPAAQPAPSAPDAPTTNPEGEANAPQAGDAPAPPTVDDGA